MLRVPVLYVFELNIIIRSVNRELFIKKILSFCRKTYLCVYVRVFARLRLVNFFNSVSSVECYILTTCTNSVYSLYLDVVDEYIFAFSQ